MDVKQKLTPLSPIPTLRGSLQENWTINLKVESQRTKWSTESYTGVKQGW